MDPDLHEELAQSFDGDHHLPETGQGGEGDTGGRVIDGGRTDAARFLYENLPWARPPRRVVR